MNSPIQEFFFFYIFAYKPKNIICWMSHFGLLLKLLIHLCSLLLPSVTSHHSKNPALNKFNKWTLFPSVHLKEGDQTNPSPEQPFKLLHVSDTPQQLQSLWDTVGQERIALHVTQSGRYPGGCQDCSEVPLAASKISASNSKHPSEDLQKPNCTPRPEISPRWTWICL